MTLIYIGLGAAVLIVAWAIYTYNFLVHARNKVNEAYSGIDVQLKMRHDLVPNLVETVRGYADHEHSAFDATSQLRNQAMAVSDPKAVERVENQLAQSMHAVLALAERYPDLKASQQFAKLASEISDVETEIQAARELYNSNVQFFNARAQSFPASLVAAQMHPASYPYLSFDYVETDARRLVAGKFAA